MILHLLIFLSLGAPHPTIWRLKSVYESVQPIGPYRPGKISVLTFKDDVGHEVVYRPSTPPFGMTEQQIAVYEKKEYFLTYWPTGARAMLLQVFLPETGATPICELATFAINNKTRRQQGVLEVETLEDPRLYNNKLVWKWVPCRKKS